MNKLEIEALCFFVKNLGWEDLPLTQVLEEIDFLVYGITEDELDLYFLAPEAIVYSKLVSVIICDYSEDYELTEEQFNTVLNMREEIAESMKKGCSFAEALVELDLL